MTGLLILLAFLMAGTLVQHWTSAPIPPSIIGMLLLLVFLISQRKVPAALTSITQSLAPILPLFLIPVSVGVITHEQLVREHGLLLLLILAISLIPGTLVCGWIMSRGKRS
ncbi:MULTISPECIES: CidA/LrgA family protein [unclassified Oceanobacter]|uniref:CidA/LrgA family protein n=1 Tax=unclassified Oceanobacter TaxID=2620260 RepID=UPI0026E2CA56|nr:MULTISPECIES: CidA/LrgA family protein [unclassified Oceanobacter]MDO6680734.1 CidA/LrgA family protein [Oceanobacter sp. 5_MG-2023]MDP2504502.1 CidA/LrgA family protein [Oceanobacter sp. 3_MG-2023]MDP2547044.1 CidA/LrgA family protein [Oceanobacter sp. 4_MG-2023]MDP2607868.1 CidA/LrgA family protein [Oceanobacter sp. 1_MG-2023]MDP2610948.1 CidA/LrgA family protein [Oceanobacter sp. 2_MG-2023]